MQIYTVAELTDHLQRILEEHYAEVWVTGELSNFKAHGSGHYYFRLKDSEAVLDAVMFRGANRNLRFVPQDGLAVLCQGQISFYRPQGRCQLIVHQMEPQGIGALQLAFEQLKAKLTAAGLFAEEHKQALPLLPRQVGIITSLSGAALQDILNICGRRFRDLPLLIHPVSVQGKGAAEEIVAAIAAMNQRADCDVLIVGRGGGSLEDLWAFNEESVARAIFNSKIPIVSAVGHETDFTIADFVADLRAPTPSAAAELVVPERAALLEEVQLLRRRLSTELQELIARRRETLKHWRARLKDPRRRLEEWIQRVDELQEHLSRGTLHQLRWLNHQRIRWQERLEALSPLTILARGYCIALPIGSEQPLTDAREVAVGAVLRLRLAHGGLLTQVQSKT